MPAPHEIIASPLTIWLAPTGTAFPDLDDAPAGTWKKLGSEGHRNLDEDGVEIAYSQTIEEFRGQSTTIRKVFRTEEGMAMTFTLVDLSPEMQALAAFDDTTLTTIAAAAGVAGEKKFSTKKGTTVEQYALLARGESTVDNGLITQHQWPTVFQSGEPSPVFSKGDPAGLELEFTAMEVTSGQFGDTRIQTAVPTS